MKKTPLAALPEGIPAEVASLLEGAPLYDSSSSPEARVIYTPRDGGLYLKRSPRGTLAKEAEMTSYFYKKGLSAKFVRKWLIKQANNLERHNDHRKYVQHTDTALSEF